MSNEKHGATHTPGPWTIVEYGDGDSLAIHDGDSDNRICFMATHGGSRKAWEAIQANAALIAAAPDLLAALEALNDCPYVIDQDTVPRGKQPSEAPDQVVMTLHIGGRVYANMRAAISRATTSTESNTEGERNAATR